MLAPGHCGAARYKLARDENWKEREREIEWKWSAIE